MNGATQGASKALRVAFALLAGASAAAMSAHAQTAGPETFQGASAAAPLLPVKAERDTGRVLVTLPPAAADGISARFLYATALKTGLGSAPIRIDKGMVGDTQVLAFRRLGKKVAVLFENPRYRS